MPKHLGRLVQLVNLLHLLLGQFDTDRLDRVLQLFDLGRPNDRSSDERLGGGPCEGDVRHGDPALLGDLFDLGDDGLGCGARFAAEGELLGAVGRFLGRVWAAEDCDISTGQEQEDESETYCHLRAGTRGCSRHQSAAG